MIKKSAYFLLIISLLFSNLFADTLDKSLNLTKAQKEKKIYPRAKKILEKLCNKDISLSNIENIYDLKTKIKDEKLCKKMSDKNLNSIVIYLWDNKNEESELEEIYVEEKARCPVCAMFVAKYPRWAAQIIYNGHTYSFDGVKDLMKFYFEPSAWGNYPFKTKDIKKILVTDYYAQETIDGFKAYYVLRSNVYGPMGHELIPFKELSDAEVFKKDHEGKEIIRFNEISKKGVYKLDEL